MDVLTGCFRSAYHRFSALVMTCSCVFAQRCARKVRRLRLKTCRPVTALVMRESFFFRVIGLVIVTSRRAHVRNTRAPEFFPCTVPLSHPIFTDSCVLSGKRAHGVYLLFQRENHRSSLKIGRAHV